MKFEFGKPRRTAFSPDDVVAVMRARSAKSNNAETASAAQVAPSYTVAEGSAQSDPIRRENMLRARIADTEKLIMTAPPGDRRDMHVRMLPVYKKQLADLERSTVPTPKTAEFPPEHEMVTPEDLFRVEPHPSQAPSPTGTHEVRRANVRFGPDDVTGVINARYKKDATPTPKEPTTVSTPETKPQVAQEPNGSEKEAPKNKGKEHVINVPGWELETMESGATSEQGPQEKQGTSNEKSQEQQPQKEAASPDVPKPTPEMNQPENNPAPETKETKHTPVDPWVERYLAAQFNVRKEDIEKIEGFGDLTVPQQKSICENLAQLTLGSVQEEAARSVSRAVGMRKSEMVKNYGRFLGCVLSGAREALFGRYNAFTAEKDVAKEMRTGGIQKHGQLLTELVQNMRTYGPRIHENAQGELVVDLVNIRERARDKSTRDAEWFAMNELNAVAHEFAKTPSDWRGQTLGVDAKHSGGVMRFFKEKVLRTSGVVQEGAYTKREEAYARAKRNLETILRKKGEDERSIADTLLALDTRVYQMQTLSTNPNAMEELAQIKDKSFFVESAKTFFSGPGAYMALGTVGRTLGGAALGFLGAPVVAGAIGSLRSWNRTAAELRERDRNARVGIKDTKGGSLNVVSAERAEQTVMVNGAPVPNGLTAKLNRLLSSLEHAEGEEKKQLLAQLRTRIEYTHDKQRLHRIDYGATEGRVTRQAELAKALAKGLVYLSMEEEAKSADVKQRTEKVQGRLAKNLSRTEKMIIEARMKGRRSDLLKSAGVAASFSIAGALLAQIFNGDLVSGVSSHEPATAAGASPEAVANGAAGATPGGAEHAVSPEAVASAHTAATETMAPSLETPAPYTVQRGDSLWNILSHETALKDLGETRARENAVGNILKLLTPAQLQEMGITSGDVRIIHPGDMINMEKVSEVLKQHKDIIESARSRFGYLPLDADPKEIIPH